MEGCCFEVYWFFGCLVGDIVSGCVCELIFGEDGDDVFWYLLFCFEFCEFGCDE